MNRCPICDWPMAETRDDGCIEGDCAYRPREGSPEWHEVQRRRQIIANMLDPNKERRDAAFPPLSR